MRGWGLLFIILSVPALAQVSDTLLLKNYQPIPAHKVPITKVVRAKYRVIDVHSHPYAESKEDIERWVANMDQFGISKTILLTYATGAKFDSLISVYKPYGDRFELWCGFDYTGYNEPGWSDFAIKELERCKKMGAKGIGELGDKGKGLFYSYPTPAWGMHIDDPRMQPLLRRCGELDMPVNIHVAEPIWMYEPLDAHNDGYMNGEKWHIDTIDPSVLSHSQLIGTLENAVKANPGTTFIACHFANCSYDLSILGDLLDKYPNLYADISARYGETATIPRHVRSFYIQYQNRLLFGTDMGFEKEMYEVVFRILETEDEHFYKQNYFNYHWPLYGFGLPDKVLKKIYYKNAEKILK